MTDCVASNYKWEISERVALCLIKDEKKPQKTSAAKLRHLLC